MQFNLSTATETTSHPHGTTILLILITNVNILEAFPTCGETKELCAIDGVIIFSDLNSAGEASKCSVAETMDNLVLFVHKTLELHRISMRFCLRSSH